MYVIDFQDGGEDNFLFLATMEKNRDKSIFRQTLSGLYTIILYANNILQLPPYNLKFKIKMIFDDKTQ